MSERNGPARLSAVVGGVPEVARLADRVQQIMDATPDVDMADDNPATVTEEVQRLRGETAAAVWRRTLAGWPDGRALAGASLAGLRDSQGAADIRAWVREPHTRALLLAGKVGRGKTWAAFAAANSFAERGALVRAFPLRKYLDSLMPDAGDEPHWRIRSQARNAHVLLVDDLGAGLGSVATPFAQRETCSLLNDRLDDRRITVITTNLSYTALCTMFEDRIVSRLGSVATVVQVTGPDRRGKRADW
jgi:hypothetical protein